jgi:hypothetical protein
LRKDATEQPNSYRRVCIVFAVAFGGEIEFERLTRKNMNNFCRALCGRRVRKKKNPELLCVGGTAREFWALPTEEVPNSRCEKLDCRQYKQHWLPLNYKLHKRFPFFVSNFFFGELKKSVKKKIEKRGEEVCFAVCVCAHFEIISLFIFLVTRFLFRIPAWKEKKREKNSPPSVQRGGSG